MSFNKKALFFMLLIGMAFTLPGFANDLDDECKTFCTNNGLEDGHYLPPEPGAACNEGYEQSQENQICCCKSKVEE